MKLTICVIYNIVGNRVIPVVSLVLIICADTYRHELTWSHMIDRNQTPLVQSHLYVSPVNLRSQRTALHGAARVPHVLTYGTGSAMRRQLRFSPKTSKHTMYDIMPRVTSIWLSLGCTSPSWTCHPRALTQGSRSALGIADSPRE